MSKATIPASTELRFSLQQLTNCISRIADSDAGPSNALTDVARDMVDVLNDSLRDPQSGESNAALVRFFMTVPYESLEASGRDFIESRFSHLHPLPDTKCLTLMGTVGDEPDWCEV